MVITLTLPDDAAEGLARAALEANQSQEDTAVELMRDILIGLGFIESRVPTNDNGDA